MIGSDNGLFAWCQAIIWSNDGISLTGRLETNFGEIFIKFLTFAVKKMRLKVSSKKWRPFCLGLNVLAQLQFQLMETEFRLHIPVLSGLLYFIYFVLLS